MKNLLRRLSVILNAEHGHISSIRFSLLVIAVAGVTAAGMIGCLASKVPTNAITPSAMTETSVRIGIYHQQNQHLPQNLSVLPVRNGYANRTTDAWNRQLEYTTGPDNTFALSSLGADGKVGGTGLDADLQRQYRIVDGQVQEFP